MHESMPQNIYTVFLFTRWKFLEVCTSLLYSLVDYEAQSEHVKRKIDLFSSINCYGKMDVELLLI